ncbi:hypothetical protein L596_006620 [Steinernema carpocapsae]|uniref:Beta-catenin-interacting ICAT domain-containing protein n=1 Tax=Steinernema carpocapsae TaxID=34508 RepID=A0A4U8VA05_STECR|nr:hypothetical protein L596_006620 [Steinernema carpocapsae]
MENQRLINNVHEQLDRLSRQLREIENEKEEMDEEDYLEMKTDTIEQLKKKHTSETCAKLTSKNLSLTLERIQSGDMTVFDQVSTTRLAIRAAVSQAFKTPEIIMLFVKKEPPILRQKLEHVESEHRLKRIEEGIYKERKYEILLALQKLGDALRPEEDQFLKDHSSFLPSDFELVDGL